MFIGQSRIKIILHQKPKGNSYWNSPLTMFEKKKNQDDDQYFSLTKEDSPNRVTYESCETKNSSPSERNDT